MKVRWTASARQDRIEIRDYLEKENLPAAIRMDALFSKAAASLGNYPNLGHSGLTRGTRELIPHKSYRLVYEIDGQTVWVLSLVHTARQWPPTRK